MVDQSAIGKSARANPVTYVGAWDTIRKRFAAEALSRERGYTADTFGFNAGTGRCPTCQGAGFEHVEMQFLSDVYLRCPDCDGKRFRPEVLEVEWLGADGQTRNVWQFLEMTVQEAVVAFGAHRDVVRALEPLTSVGLGYLRLGQPLPTLSGGEAQRLKLARNLVRTQAGEAGRTLYLFDEPTTGLHFEDIAKLLKAFRRLIAAGHSLIVIEHKLDVIAAWTRSSTWVRKAAVAVVDCWRPAHRRRSPPVWTRTRVRPWPPSSPAEDRRNENTPR